MEKEVARDFTVVFPPGHGVVHSLHGFAGRGRLEVCESCGTSTALCMSSFDFQLALLACPTN